jgi:hypothetical protein
MYKSIILLTRISGSHGGEYEHGSLEDMAPCSLVEVDRRFRCAHFLHHQGVNDRDSKHLWKVGLLLQPYSVPYSGRLSHFYFYLFHK